MKRRVGAIFAACLAFLFLAAPALADTWTVTGTGDQTSGCVTSTHLCPSLRAAIAASEATKNLKDVINVPPGVVSLNNDLVIQSDMEILGDSARTTILDGNLKYRAFRITTAGTDVDIRHLTIRNAQAGQAAVTDGGGIYNQGVLELSYVRITTSRAPEGGGGAIANNRGVIVMDHSLIDGNTAQSVGGIWNVGGPETANRGWLRIDDSTVFNNSAALAGVGGIASTGGLSSILLLFRATVANNNGAATRGLGGGVYVTTGQAQSTGSLLARNMAAGVVSNCDGSVAVVNNGGNVEDEKTCGFSIQSVNPQLATSLKNEGGEVDVLPIANGPAVDVVPVGTNTCASGTRDARGMYRPQGTACDAGAYELDQPATVTITDGPSGTVTTGDVLFNFQASELDVTVQCQLTGPGQGGGFVGCYKSNAQPYDKLADGTYTFSVRAVSSSFPNPPTTTRTFTVDTTPPETTITGGPSGPTNVSNPQFTFTSSETPSTFECAIDSGQFAACTSPYTAPTLTPGQHTFRVRATDATQHTDQSPATRTFTFDNVAPNTTIDTGPSNTVASTSAAFTYSSSEPNSTFECKLDSGNFGACPSGYTGLAQGVHTFQVRAIDAATNVDATPASRTWTVDTVGPETTITNGPPTVAASTSATFTYTSSEGNSTFECALDGAAFGTCPAGYTGLSQGAHTFQVRARDALGNPDPTPASRTWTVDTVAPDTTITSGPPTATASTTAAFTFISNEGGVLFECSLDSAAFGSCPVNYAGLAQGSHTFQVRAKDAAGNLDPTPAGQTWTVDTVNPDTTISAPAPSPSNDTTPTFGFTSNEAGATFQCRIDGTAFATCPTPFTSTALAAGTHTLDVRARDAAGNLDGTPASQTFEIDLTAPTARIDSAPTSPTNDNTPTFGFSSEAGATFECRVDAAAFAQCTSPHTTAQLADGTHTFEVRAKDVAGNTGAAASRTIVVDTVAPDTTLTNGPASPSNDPAPTFTFTGTGTAFECRVDSAVFTTCSSPHTTVALNDGGHTFQVRARDAAGNVDTTPAAQTFVIDTGAPETTLTVPAPSPSNDTTPTFAFTGTGAAFECRIDTAAFAACTSPFTSTPLSAGTHTFEVRALDAAGNADLSPASQTFVIDTTAPQTSILAGPNDPTNVRRPPIAFSSSESGSTFECALDSTTFAACTSPFTPASDLAAGSHTFQVRATDPAGNLDASPASVTFAVDLTAPDTTLLTTPPAQTNDNTPTFTFSSEAGARFECRVDSAAFASCTTPFTAAALGDGAHAFDVRAIDSAGNVDGSPAHSAFTVDTVLPQTTIDSGPPNPGNSSRPQFTFSSSEANSTFRCTIDGGTEAACSSPFTTATLPDGTHTLAVVAVDQATNRDDSPATRTFVIDTQAPTTTITAAPTSPSRDTTPTFEFSANEANSTFECRVGTGQFALCTSPHTTAALLDGSRTFEVRAKDAAGNVGAAASRTLVIDTTAPETTILTGPSGPTNDPTPTFTFGSSESGSAFECRVDTEAFAVCTSPATTLDLDDGTHTFAVRATDAAGNQDASAATQTFVVDTDPPDTTLLTGAKALSNNRTPSFTFSGTGSGFQCRVDGGAYGACASGYTAPQLDAGSHTFDVRAVDAADNVDGAPASQTFVIDLTAPQTTIDTGPPAATNDPTADFTFSASESGSTFKCRVDNVAFATCTSPHATVPLSQGTHTFEVLATDPAGNDDPSAASRTFTVDTTAPAAPAITSGPKNPGNDTTPTFEFTGEAGASFQCRVDGGSYAGCTSPRTTAALGEGGHTFEVRAVDAATNAGPAASRDFVIDVTPPVASFTAGPSGPTNDATPEFEFTAADSTFECRLDGGTFAACTSPRTTATLPEGTHTFEIRATDSAGNTDTESRTFVVDVTKPPAPVITEPTPGQRLTSSTVGVRGTAEAETVVTVYEGTVSQGSGRAGTAPWLVVAVASDGTHTFTARAKDDAGNESDPSVAVTFSVDSDLPDTTISGTDGAINTATPTFTLGADEDTSKFECRVVPADFSTCASPYTPPALGEGPHTIEVRAFDLAGNPDNTPATRNVVVDLTAPAAPAITGGPTGASNISAAEFTFTTTEPDATLECALDDGAFAECVSPARFEGIGEGAHTFRVRTRDDAGNTGDATRAFAVDRTPPAAPAVESGPAGATTDASPAFAFTATDTVDCKLDGPNGAEGSFGPCASPKSFDALAPGEYLFTVRSTDAAGNRTASTRAFTVTVPQQQTPTPTPTPTPTATATPSPTPQPTPSQTVVVAPKAGTILVKVPGGKTFEPLDVTKGIPNGSEVDARKGHVTLTSIPKAGAPTETAEFWDGLFIVTQKRGVTTVKLSEKLTGCPKGLRSSAKAAAKKTKVRRLWGSGKGSFRTEGRYSAATVRGTVWLVQDTCTTTLTRVTQGVVAVNDFAKKKTIVLKKGKRYTAKRR